MKNEPDFEQENVNKVMEKCTWMHRTAIIMSDGEVTTCGKHYGEKVGELNDQTTFMDIWNGSRMQSLRKSFGTPHMWQQCRDCWLRELKWHSQRCAKNSGHIYLDEKPTKYTHRAWDYRDYDPL
jgi:radical SAM protein with 4Fe4S-binding SPASM domain